MASTTTKSKHRKNVERVLLTSSIGLMLFETLLPMLIVNFSLLSVAENVIGVGDLLHALLGLPVARIFVGMELQAELAIGAFNILLTGAFLETQHSVVVGVSQDNVHG